MVFELLPELAVERFQKESQQLQGRLNYLTLQHDELQQKNKELSAQLVRAKAEEEQFKRLSETLETTLKGNSEAEMAKITALTDQLDSLSQQLEEKQKNYDDLMGKYKGLEEAKMKLREEFDKQTVLNNYQIATLQGNLAREKTNVAELERSRQDWVNERESLRGEAKDWESQYQRELDSHEADVSKLRAAAEEVSSFQQQLAEAEVNFNEVVEARDRLQAELDDRDNLLVADNNRLQERMKLIEAENEKLLDEVQKLANQIVLTERLARGSGDQAVAEPASLAEDSSEISSASTESLAEIISYLRRERQLASQKEADAVEEANRATRRAEVLEKDRNRLELKLTEATEEMAVLSAAVSEKAALLEKLRVMEAIQLHNGQLNAQVANCEAQLKVLENQLADCRQELLASQNENLNVQSQLDNANAEISAIAQELAVWRQRYDELLAQRSDTEAQEIVRLTNELAEMQEKLDAVSMELRTEREKCGVIESLNRDMSAIAESHKERLEKFDQLNAELEEMTAKNNEANAKLRQAQIIGRKYRDQTVELNQTVKSLKEQLESAKTGSTSEQPSSTGNSVQIEALMNENQMLNDQLNELRSTSINQAEGAEMRDAELQSLQERIEQLETDKIALEAALRTSEEKLEAVAKEKSELEMKLEEINMRLVSLTSMHKTCEQRITKVTQDKSEELNRMAANFEKQLAELRSHGKPALVPPYVQSQTPRLPSTSSPRYCQNV